MLSKGTDHGIYNASPPVLNSGDISTLQLDEHGYLKVALQSGSVGVTSLNGLTGDVDLISSDNSINIAVVGQDIDLKISSSGVVLSISGVSGRITTSAHTGNVIVDIDAAYVGQTSITTLGTIGTGIWRGTAIDGTYINYNTTNLKTTASQLNTIQNIDLTASPQFVGLNLSGLTASQLVATDSSKNLQTLTTATYPSLTEISYVKGVTSSIQAQINAITGGTVVSVSGTANQIDANTVGGAVTLSLSSTIVTPGTLAVNGALATNSSTTLNATGAYNTVITGTQTAQTSNNQTALQITTLFQPPAQLSGYMVAIDVTPTFTIGNFNNPAITKAAGIRILTNFIGTVTKVVTDLYGLYVPSGTGGTAGFTRSWGGYFEQPGGSSNTVALGAANFLVGYPTTNFAPPGGAFILGQVSLGVSTPAIGSYQLGVGTTAQFQISTSGIVTAGTWQGSKIGLIYGGTNADLSTTGGTSQYLKQSSSGAAITVGTIPASDISSGQALTKTDDTNVTLTLGGTPTTSLLVAVSLTLGWTGLLGLTRGGSNANLVASNGGIVWSNASQMQILAGTATASKMLLSGATATPSWSTSTIPTSAGATANKVLLSDGTNYVLSTPTFPNASATAGKLIRSDGTNWLASSFTMPDTYTTGDIIQASATSVFSALASVATGNALISGGVATVSSWGKIGLTTHITGTLAVGNGGTGTGTAFTTGSVVYADGSGIYSQDNANFFWDATNHRLSLGSTTTTSLLNVGTSAQFQIDTSGHVGINQSPVSTTQLSITASGTYGMYMAGTLATASTSHYMTLIQTTSSPSSSSYNSYACALQPTFNSGSSGINSTFGIAISPTFTGSGTINEYDGFLVDTGTLTGTTLTTAYGFRSAALAVGVTRIGLYIATPSATGATNVCGSFLGYPVNIGDQILYEASKVTCYINRSSHTSTSTDLYQLYIQGSMGATGAGNTVNRGCVAYIYPNFSANVGTLNTAYGLLVDPGATAGTIGTASGIWITALTYGTTLKYGLYVAQQSGATTNYTAYLGGMYIDGTGHVGVGGTPDPAADMYLSFNRSADSGNLYGIEIGGSYKATNTHTVGAANGIFIYMNNGSNVGTISSSAGIEIGGAGSPAGVVTNAYGLLVDAVTWGTGTSYGLFVSVPSGATNNYGAFIGGVIGLGAAPLSATGINCSLTVTGTSGNIVGARFVYGMGASSGTVSRSDNLYSSCNMTGNVGTTTLANAIFIDAGATAGTVTSGTGLYITAIGYGVTRYGAYINSPGAGTNYASLYTDDLSVGVTAISTAPTKGTIRTAPPASNTTTTSGSWVTTLTKNTAVQNTTGYDLICNIVIAASAAVAGTILLGVGPSSTPTTNTAAAAFTASVLTIICLTAYVPANYYLIYNTGGTSVTVTNVTVQSMGV